MPDERFSENGQHCSGRAKSKHGHRDHHIGEVVPLDHGQDLHERQLKSDDGGRKKADRKKDLSQVSIQKIYRLNSYIPIHYFFLVKGTKLTGMSLLVVIFPFFFSTSISHWVR